MLKKYRKSLSIIGSMLLIFVMFKVTSTEGGASDLAIEVEVETQIVKQIKVHVVGAVMTEGVYELQEGARLEDAIKAAGGITKEANEEFLNFAKVLNDGEKITVLNKKDMVENIDTEDQQVPNYANANYSILEKLNYMTAEEYQKVPGIGEKTSAEIIRYRESVGQFSSIEALKEVSGIGQAKCADIVAFLE